MSNFTTQPQRFAFYPDLKFVCDATITRWWIIGRLTGSTSDPSSIMRTSLIVASQEETSDGIRYVRSGSVAVNRVTSIPTGPTLLESNVSVRVRANDAIVIVQPFNTDVRFEILYESGKGPAGYFRQQQETIGATLVYRTSSEGTTKAMDYPMLAVETSRW